MYQDLHTDPQFPNSIPQFTHPSLPRCYRNTATWGFSVLLVVVGWRAGARSAGDGVKGLARGCAREIIAGLYHVRQVAPSVGSWVPGNRAVADGEIDITSCKYPSAVVNTGGRS